MSSGVVAASECLDAFSELKMSKTLKYITFQLSDDKKAIVVGNKSTDADYDTFLQELRPDGCKWAVYDFSYKLDDGSQRNKLVFFSWSPDTAPIRAKMLHSSSKDALRRSLDGIGIEVQGTDATEVAHEAVLEKVKRFR